MGCSTCIPMNLISTCLGLAVVLRLLTYAFGNHRTDVTETSLP